MSQTAYNLSQSEAYAGMKADSRFDTVESFAAEEAIPFGAGVGAEAGELVQVRVPNKDVATVVFDADFVASNSIAVSVNSVAITPVVFAADHDTTAAALAAAIDALSGVTCSLLASDATNRTFVIEAENTTIAVTAVVTLGASQAVATITYTSDDLFRGIALSTHKEQTSAGVAQYAQYEAVSVLRKGCAWVNASKAVTADSTAYLIPDGLGKFTDASSGNIATGGKFRSTVAAAGLVKLEIDL